MLSSVACLADTSELWGTQGELWTPSSRLPDFSFAGYQSGISPIPSPPAVVNVRDFGAIGNGIADDTNAFEAAIAAATNGAVWIPAGRYQISRVLYIRKSNLVLRGAGQGATTLVFTKHLSELIGLPPGQPASKVGRGAVVSFGWRETKPPSSAAMLRPMWIVAREPLRYPPRQGSQSAR